MRISMMLLCAMMLMACGTLAAGQPTTVPDATVSAPTATRIPTVIRVPTATNVPTVTRIPIPVTKVSTPLVIVEMLDHARQPVSIANGVIFDTKGLVLTTFDVIGDRSDNSLRNSDGLARISAAATATLPPVPIGYANVIFADQDAQMAVLQFVRDAYGAPLTRCLDLPAAQRANTSAVVGDTVSVSGYRGASLIGYREFRLDTRVTRGVSYMGLTLKDDGLFAGMVLHDVQWPVIDGAAVRNNMGELVGIVAPFTNSDAHTTTIAVSLLPSSVSDWLYGAPPENAPGCDDGAPVPLAVEPKDLFVADQSGVVSDPTSGQPLADALVEVITVIPDTDMTTLPLDDYRHTVAYASSDATGQYVIPLTEQAYADGKLWLRITYNGKLITTHVAP